MKFLDKLLDYYNLDIKQYESIKKKISFNSIPLFTSFTDIDIITNKILEKIKEKKKILVYGDYDADGVLATSIMVYTLRKLKADCSYYIPSRYIDTYGLTVEKVKIAKEKGFDLIITVDNGVSCQESIDLCKQLGLDIIITDHHEYGDGFRADYFLHPKRSTLTVTTSGATTAFYLSYSLLKEIDPYLLSLAGISIISDMMPMKKENKDLVKLALELINKNKFRQITILSGFYNFDERILAMNLISKINGVGRICQNKDINLLVKYFTTEDFRTLYLLRDKFNEINDSKRDLIKNAVNETHINVTKDDSSIVIKSNAILGLGGVLSNKYLAKYNLPTAVFIEDKGKLRGSIRSKQGCDISFFLNENKDLFVDAGGHKNAAGVTIEIDKLDEFKNRFDLYCKDRKVSESKSPINILIDEINMENYEILKSFSPFGEGFEEPVFLLNNLIIDSYSLFGDSKRNLKIKFNNASVVWFNFDKNIINNKHSINLKGTIRLSTFKNNSELQFLVINE